jgi:hypothetical protein
VVSARYVYAIVGRGTPLPPAGSCVSAHELAIVPWRELAAVTRRIEEGQASFTMEAVMHHEAVVEAVRHQGAALPVRFGTLLRDAASVASALAERYDALVEDLQRLGDKVELSLTAIWSADTLGAEPNAARDEPAVRDERAGAGYLRARAAELRRDEGLADRARTIAERFDHALRGHALEQRVSLLPKARLAMRAAYLLEPSGVGAFRAACETVRRTLDETRVLLTGPWPPYTFVRRPGQHGGASFDGRLAEIAHLLTTAVGHPWPSSRGAR